MMRNCLLLLGILFLIVLSKCKQCQAQQPGAVIVRISDSDSANAESSNNNDEADSDVFVATDEWKEIQPGQQIPAGLHVRLNLQTGKKEAKLIDTDEENQQASLKKISDDVLEPKVFHHEERAFKSIDQIKKEFADLKLNIKTDYEILIDLISRLKLENNTNEALLEIFSDLEYILHQYDNAQDFVKLGGLQLVIPALNSSNDDVRASAAFLLGSALQSNPAVQVAALKSTLLMMFVRIIIWDPSISVQKHAMFALSCLIRHFPLAQQYLIDQGGFAALAEMFRQKQHATEFDKLLLKSVTLIHDLMQEQKSVMDNMVAGDEVMKEKLRQYKRVKLAQAVNEQGWCSLIPKLLHSPDHDDREKIMRCMLLLIGNCQAEFKDYRPQLSRLRGEYQVLAQAEVEEPDRYFTELYQLTVKLLQQLVNDTVRDEL